MDETTPSWLQEGEESPTKTPEATTPLETPVLDSLAQPRSAALDIEGGDTNVGTRLFASSGAAKNNKKANKEKKEEEPADPEDMSHVVTVMRLANLGVSVAIIIASVFNILRITAPAAWVLSFYAIALGGMSCCFETQLKFIRAAIATNFGFFFSSGWRFMFYLLMASLLVSYESILGYIVAGVTIFVAFFNTYVLCRYPTYRAIRQKMAEEEDKRIQGKIKKGVAKQAVTGWNSS
mmetsp:Transcript_8914/g.12998  ORF Transcript_8914/g.12998 Transcript_8914/m.12998 type:complete len:236 (-) Transcript_8914:310-1017(-)